MSETVQLTNLNSTSADVEDDFEKEDSSKYDSVQWDYVLTFGNLDPPTEKGNQLPEDNPKMKRFRENEKKRRQLVKRLKNPNVGLIVTRKRASDGKSIFVLISATQERLEKQAEVLAYRMKLKPEYGGGYAEFELEDKSMFLNSDSEHGFFRKNQRHFLIESIVQGDPVYGGADINLGRLSRAGVITKIFPLHDDERRNLLDNWANWKNMFKFQPVEAIRNYYGEEVGFYFAWLGFYTSWLWAASLIGLVCFILYVTDRKGEWGIWVITGYSIFLAFWATLFLEYWKRYNATLAFQWGMMDYEDVEVARANFTGQEAHGIYSKGHWVPLDPNKDYGFPLPKKTRYYPSKTRIAKVVSTFPLIATMITVVVVATFAVLSFRLFVQLKTIGFVGSLVGGIINAMTIIFMNVVWKNAAVRLTEWENHRTQSEFDNALIFKIFVFYFVNSYTSLYYIAFFKNGFNFWNAGTVIDGCKFKVVDVGQTIAGGCVDELTFQLATILGTNMIFGQTREVLLPFLLSKINLLRLKKATGQEDNSISQWEKESKKAAYQGTFDEYSEMIIQYGYLTLFASAFPLAPMMAVINNMIEIRTDAFKLLSSTNRPDYKGAEGIGNWYGVLEVIGIVAVITNCLLIGFSFGALAKALNEDKFVTLGVIVIMEHGILFIKYLIALLVPDVPGNIVKELGFQEFCKEQIVKKLTGVKPPTNAVDDTDDLNEVDKLIEANEASPISLTSN